MKVVEFKYEINQRIKTRYGTVGFIDALQLGPNDQLYYYVKWTPESGAWLQEDEFTPLDDDDSLGNEPINK